MKIIAVGWNYADHNKEMKREDLPVEPTIFMKPDSALLKDGKPFLFLILPHSPNTKRSWYYASDGWEKHRRKIRLPVLRCRNGRYRPYSARPATKTACLRRSLGNIESLRRFCRNRRIRSGRTDSEHTKHQFFIAYQR